MLSKEEIEAWFDAVVDNKAIAQDLKQLALVGLSVQEGVKDARKAFEAWGKARGLNTDQEIGKPGVYWHSVTSRLWDGWEAAWKACAAFALKQGGEVLSEFDSEVASIDDTGHGVLQDSPPMPLKIGQRVHVIITAPKPLDVEEKTLDE